MNTRNKISIIGAIPIIFATGIFGLGMEPSVESNEAVTPTQNQALSESENNAILLETDASLRDADIRCHGSQLCITGKIVQIVDGDTIHLDGGYKVRLSLTNTPERHELGFYEASQFTAGMCPVGTKVTVDQDDKQPNDIYDRMLGKVTCGGKVLNSELLYAGHANILTRYCSTSEFSNETWAQEFGC